MLNLEQTCNKPTPSLPRADRNPCKVIGAGLPAFLLSKNFYSDSIGMFQLHRNVSGGTYPIALRDLAFQLSSQKLDPSCLRLFQPPLQESSL